MSEILFARRTSNHIRKSNQPGEVFRDWKGDAERWLFISPHDDDIVLGAGLHFIAAIESGVSVYAIVSTIGAGYCRIEDKDNIAKIRRAECCKSFGLLGLPPKNLMFYNYPANTIMNYRGRYNAHRSDIFRDMQEDTSIFQPTAIAGADGLQNSFTWSLRLIRPTRVFLPSQTDIHPAHRVIHEELVISIFHAQGVIWPELGEPVASFPRLYEYATYNDYLTPPNHRVKVSQDLFDRKLAGIAAYESQQQIKVLVANIRNQPPREYVREMEFKIYDPSVNDGAFDEESDDDPPTGSFRK